MSILSPPPMVTTPVPQWLYPTSTDKTNASIYVDLTVAAVVVGVWFVSIFSSAQQMIEKRLVSDVLVDGCRPVKSTEVLKKMNEKTNFLFKPRLILTRKYASTAFAGALAMLVMVSKIINGARMATALPVIGTLLVFFGVDFFEKSFTVKRAGSNFRSVYALKSFISFMYVIATLILLFAYTDSFGTRSFEGKDDMYIAAGVFASVAILAGFFVSILPQFQPFVVSDDSNLSLIFGGEYYMSFNALDYMVCGSSIIIFLLWESANVARMEKDFYAAPIIMLMIIPMYGFAVNLYYFSVMKNKISYAYNIGIFMMITVALTNTMLHVCAVPGVTRACAQKLSHKPVNNVLLVLMPYMLVVFLSAVGLVRSTFAPAFLISATCFADKNGDDALPSDVNSFLRQTLI